MNLLQSLKTMYVSAQKNHICKIKGEYEVQQRAKLWLEKGEITQAEYDEFIQFCGDPEHIVRKI